MTELNETAPLVGYGIRPRRTGVENGLQRKAASRSFRSTTASPLSQTVEVAIIPRLVMAHGVVKPPLVTSKAPADDCEVADFAQLMLGSQSNEGAERIQSYRDRGVGLETIYLDLLVPAARHLRQLWMDDEWDFAEVTLALWRLQQLVRDNSPAFCAEAAIKSAGLRALLAPGPGEKHDIGHMMFLLVLAGEFLRRDGWNTWIEPDSTGAAFIDTLRTQWFDVVEFFASSNKKLDDLASNIRMVRRESSNRDIGVMVCGPAFTERPELVLLVGGDAVVSDFTQEALQARNVVELVSDR